MKWRVVITPAVQAAIRTFPPETKRYIRQGFEEVRKDPFAGKALKDDLAELYSFRVRRFRIVYRVEKRIITVLVVGVGHRRTIYRDVLTEMRSS